MSPEGLWKSGLQGLMSQFLLVLQVKVKEVEEAVGKGTWPGMEGSGQGPTLKSSFPNFVGTFPANFSSAGQWPFLWPQNLISSPED